MTITDTTILVTGANRGVGQALVHAGTRQPLTHPDVRVVPLPLDVTDAGQIAAAVGFLTADLLTTQNWSEPMNDTSYTTTITVDRTAEEVFSAITDVRAWWSGEIDGVTDQLGAEFTYRYEDVHRSTQQITELVPGRRVAWHVVDGYLSFVEDKTEWTGTDITFDISPAGDQTQVRFTHLGLRPEGECFDSCSSAWHFYINTSLRNLITTGTGQPND